MWRSVRTACSMSPIRCCPRPRLPTSTAQCPPQQTPHAHLHALRRHRVQVIDPTNGTLVKYFRAREGAYHLNAPCGVAFTPSGLLCVADSGKARLVLLTAAGSLVATVGGEGREPGSRPPCARAVPARHARPRALARRPGRAGASARAAHGRLIVVCDGGRRSFAFPSAVAAGGQMMAVADPKACTVQVSIRPRQRGRYGGGAREAGRRGDDAPARRQVLGPGGGYEGSVQGWAGNCTVLAELPFWSRGGPGDPGSEPPGVSGGPAALSHLPGFRPWSPGPLPARSHSVRARAQQRPRRVVRLTARRGAGALGFQRRAEARLRRPNGVAVFCPESEGGGDSSGGGATLVFVADSGNHLVRVFDASAPAQPHEVGAFGGLGRGDGHLHFPAALTLRAADGLLLVADMLNCRVQAFLAGRVPGQDRRGERRGARRWAGGIPPPVWVGAFEGTATDVLPGYMDWSGAQRKSAEVPAGSYAGAIAPAARRERLGASWALTCAAGCGVLAAAGNIHGCWVMDGSAPIRLSRPTALDSPTDSCARAKRARTSGLLPAVSAGRSGTTEPGNLWSQLIRAL